MTQYEIIDAMKGYSDSLTSAYKYWTTTTFALVAAAYVAGDGLEPVLVVALALVYLFLASGNVGMVRLYTRALSAGSEDLLAMDRGAGNLLQSTPIFASSGTRFGKLAGPMIISVMAATSIGAVGYLFYQTRTFG